MTKISELPLTSYTSTGDDHIIVNHTENSSVDTYQTSLPGWISDYISNSTLVTSYSEYHTILLAREYAQNPQRIDLDDLMSNYLSGYLSNHIGDYISDYVSEAVSDYLGDNISSIADAFNSNYPLSGLDGYISQYLDDHGGGGGGGGGDVSEAIESYFSEYPQYTVNNYLGSWIEDSPYQLSDFISDYLSDNLGYLISENISNNMSTYLSEVLVSDAYLSEIYSVIYNYPNESLDNYLSQYLNDHLSEFLP